MAQPNLNVDPSEIARFEDIASRWWDPEGDFKALHDINPLRLDYIDRRADLAGKRILDVGCGGGILSEGMAGRGATVIGIDMAEAALGVARLHGLEAGLEIDYRHATAEELAASAPHDFDIVTCLELLEHVPDPTSVIRACSQLVRPGGHVFFSTINRKPKSYLFAIIGAEYLLGLLPKGTHDYRKLIRPSELDSWCRAAGLEAQDLIGLHYNPVLRDYRLGPGVEVNYLAHYRPAL